MYCANGKGIKSQHLGGDIYFSTWYIRHFQTTKINILHLKKNKFNKPQDCLVLRWQQINKCVICTVYIHGNQINMQLAWTRNFFFFYNTFILVVKYYCIYVEWRKTSLKTISEILSKKKKKMISVVWRKSTKNEVILLSFSWSDDISSISQHLDTHYIKY